MKRKRILSILLAVVLIGILFTGACAQDEG